MRPLSSGFACKPSMLTREPMLKVSEGGCIGPGRLLDCIYRLFGFILMMICGAHSIPRTISLQHVYSLYTNWQKSDARLPWTSPGSPACSRIPPLQIFSQPVCCFICAHPSAPPPGSVVTCDTRRAATEQPSLPQLLQRPCLPLPHPTCLRHQTSGLPVRYSLYGACHALRAMPLHSSAAPISVAGISSATSLA